MLDGEAFGAEIVDLVRGYIERELTPLKSENEALKARVAALEARPAPEKGDPGDDGANIEIDAVRELVEAEVGRAIDAIPIPKDGKDAAGIVEALKDSGELVLTLQDGRLIRTGIRDGVDGISPETVVAKELEEDDALLIGATLRKELGSDLILLPDPLPPQGKTTSPVHVTVENHLPKRGVEKTTVTKHDDRGRVLEYERREI